jgi:hypothetical protein
MTCNSSAVKSVSSKHLLVYTMVSQKVPGMTWHCHGKIYGNAYLITFKVGPLSVHTHTHTHSPSILQLRKAPAEGFFWNSPEFGSRTRFDVVHDCEARPLEVHFQSREESKVARSENRRVRWLGDDRNCCTTGDVWLGALS